MKKLTFRGFMIATTAFTGLLTLLTALGYAFFCAGWLLSTAIAFGTTFYHFAMRLTVGSLIPHSFDHRKSWFQPKRFEAKLYRKLQVKKWKNSMPTFDPRLFSMAENTPQSILAHMCQAEVVHEVIILCSFLPLLFSLLWGSFYVFFITSILAAAVDTLFVIMQRYNRPRVEQLINKHTSRRYKNEKTYGEATR